MPGKYLTTNQRTFIVEEANKGRSHEDIINDFKTIFNRSINRKTITRNCGRLSRTGSLVDKPKTGAPRKYDDRETRDMVKVAMKQPLSSRRDPARDNSFNTKEACLMTVNNLLCSADVFARVLPKLFQGMNRHHVVKRYKFAREHKNWGVNEWQLVCFSDEADLFPIKSGKHFYRTRNPKVIPNPEALCEEVRPDIGIKVWGIISCYGVGPLIRYSGTMTQMKYREILENELLREYPMIEGAAFHGPEGGVRLYLWMIMPAHIEVELSIIS